MLKYFEVVVVLKQPRCAFSKRGMSSTQTSSSTRVIYNIEAVLVSAVGLGWLSVRQMVSPKWPLLDTWALGGQCLMAVFVFFWSSVWSKNTTQFPVFCGNLFVLLTYFYTFVLTVLPSDALLNATQPSCGLVNPGSYYTKLFFGNTPWNLPLSGVTLGIVLAQTVLSAACMSQVPDGIGSIAWVGLWTVASVNVHAVSIAHAGCDQSDPVWAIILFAGSVAICALWYTFVAMEMARGIVAFVLLVLTIILTIVVAVLSQTYSSINLLWFLSFSFIPLLFGIRNAIRYSGWGAEVVGADEPAAANTQPPATSSKPNPPGSEQPPASSIPTRVGSSVLLRQLNPLIHLHSPHSQSGYHVPRSHIAYQAVPQEIQGDSMRALFGGDAVRQSLHSSGQKKDE